MDEDFLEIQARDVFLKAVDLIKLIKPNKMNSSKWKLGWGIILCFKEYMEDKYSKE